MIDLLQYSQRRLAHSFNLLYPTLKEVHPMSVSD